MNNVRCPQPFITPCYGGEAESITRVSRILAQRRVRRRTGWFAPCTSSLTAVRIAYYSSSQPLELRFNHRLLGLGRRTLPGHLGQKSDDPFRTFLTKHCQECHSGEKPKGNFSLDKLATDFDNASNQERWLAVRLHGPAGSR